jgi:hypothetical protein
MSDLHTLLAAARDDFDKHRVNKAVDSLIKAVALLAGDAPADTAKQTLTEPAPAPAAPIVETPASIAAEDAAKTDETKTDEATEPKPRKRPANGTRSGDVSGNAGTIVVS